MNFFNNPVSPSELNSLIRKNRDITPLRMLNILAEKDNILNTIEEMVDVILITKSETTVIPNYRTFISVHGEQFSFLSEANRLLRKEVVSLIIRSCSTFLKSNSLVGEDLLKLFVTYKNSVEVIYLIHPRTELTLDVKGICLELFKNIILKQDRAKVRLLPSFISEKKIDVERVRGICALGKNKECVRHFIISTWSVVYIPKEVIARICYSLLFEL